MSSWENYKIPKLPFIDIPKEKKLIYSHQEIMDLYVHPVPLPPKKYFDKKSVKKFKERQKKKVEVKRKKLLKKEIMKRKLLKKDTTKNSKFIRNCKRLKKMSLICKKTPKSTFIGKNHISNYKRRKQERKPKEIEKILKIESERLFNLQMPY